MSYLQTSGLESIERLIGRTRQLLRLSWVVVGLAITGGLLSAAVLLAALIDLAITLWPSFRWIVMAMVVVPVAWSFVMGVLRSALRRLGSRGIAHRIEQHIPKIHNRLVSCVDLAAGTEELELSPAFRQRLIEEATERVRSFDPMRVVDVRRVRRALLAAAGALVLFVVAWLLLGDRLTTAIARVFHPWADIPPVSGVEYTVEPGNVSVLRGDEIEFAAHVTKGSPDSLQLEIVPEDGRPPLRYDLRHRHDNLWTFSLRGFETSFDYRVTGGGTWTRPFHVTMVDRPRLASLQATLHYPKYFGPTEPRPNPPQVADVAGPEQSEVEIAVGVGGEVVRGEIRLFQSSAGEKLVQTEALPMQPAGKSAWSGRFPLLRDGFYRVHLENSLGAANQAMKEGKLTAIVDRPPQILLEQPTGDLMLAAPQPVPMVASVYDDFALDEVRIIAHKGGAGEPRTTTLKKYSGLVRNDTANLMVDLAPYELRPGEQLRYCLEARDRKGQTTRTVERFIRISTDKHAADHQLDRFEKTQHNLQEKLRKLIAQQEKLNEKMRELAAKYAPLQEKVRQAKVAPPPAAAAAPEAKQAKAAKRAKEPEIDPETRARLERLRPELAAAANSQTQNSAATERLSAELARLAAEAAQLQMMPPAIHAELRAAQGAFDRQAAQPLREMAAEMKQEAAAKPRDVPPVADWHERGNRAGEEMAALAQRLKAIEEAQRQSASGDNEALAKLRQELLKMQAAAAVRELGPLRAEVVALQKTLQKVEEHQVGQLDNARSAHESTIPEHERKQDALEQQAAPPLAAAAELLDHQGPQPMKPQQPADEAHMEEPGESPGEQNAAAPPEAKAAEKPAAAPTEKSAATPAEKADAKPAETAAEQRYDPALGGPRPQLDARLTAKRPPPEKSPPPAPSSPEARRDALNARQFQKAAELDTAQQSLGSDVQSLDKLLAQLRQGQTAQSSEPAAPPASPAAQGEPTPPANAKSGEQQPAPPTEPAAPPASPAAQPEANPPSDSKSGQQQAAVPSDSKSGPQQPNPPSDAKTGQQQSGSPKESESTKDLSRLMQSPALERAMAMAQRLEAARAAARGQRDDRPSSQAARFRHGGHSTLGPRGPRLDQAQLDEQLRQLDPATRSMLLKMQPRVREELLQGMREEGPEGYRQFIREYFQRLTEVHNPHDR
jgi:hypothetical protein